MDDLETAIRDIRIFHCYIFGPMVAVRSVCVSRHPYVEFECNGGYSDTVDGSPAPVDR